MMASDRLASAGAAECDVPAEYDTTPGRPGSGHQHTGYTKRATGRLVLGG